MSQLDLLLINAPSSGEVYQSLSRFSAIEPPVWAAMIAEHCRRKGLSVQILDAEALGFTATAAAVVAANLRPRLAVFCIYGHQPSASTQSMPGASHLCRELKAIAPEIPTLAMGTHPSALPRRTLEEEPFDFVCEGEGPVTIEVLLLHKHIPVGSHQDVLNIPGLWQRGAGTPFFPAYNIEDLDHELPGQAFDLLPMQLYRAHNWHLWSGDPSGGYGSVQTSLGCPFKCSFCCINAPFTTNGARPRIRKWSPEIVVSQIDALVIRGITNIKIPDEMFCLDPRHVSEICRLIIDHGHGSSLNMWAYARIDTVKDDRMLELMRRAGFKWLGIGIESGSKHVRDGVEKGRFGNEEILATTDRVSGHGFHIGANYIFGLPDDTAESCEETYQLACAVNAELANFYCAMAYPGSKLHAEARVLGLKLPEDDNGPGWIGYSQHSYRSRPLSTKTLTSEQILDIRDRAWMRYFTRPEYHQRIKRTFGEKVLEEIHILTGHGMPRRAHRPEREN